MCIHVQGFCWRCSPKERFYWKPASLMDLHVCAGALPVLPIRRATQLGARASHAFACTVQEPSRGCSTEEAICTGACSLQPPGALGLLHLLHQPLSQICMHVQGPCSGWSPEERLYWECAVCNLQGFWACCVCGISLHICSSWVPAKPGPDSQWSGQCTGMSAPQPAQAECQDAE